MKKQLIGLTGGIASGKSTVVNYLRSQGYPVIDADAVVHDLQKKGGALYQALVQHFGQGILGADGELDRPKLSAQIFASPESLAQSSQLQDQIIKDELARQRDALLAQHDVLFMDIPLLFERGYQGWFDQVWLVYVDRATQVQRLKGRNGYSQSEAEQRIASQMPLDDKRALAGVVIDNNGSIEETLAQVDKLLAELERSNDDERRLF